MYHFIKISTTIHQLLGTIKTGQTNMDLLVILQVLEILCTQPQSGSVEGLISLPQSCTCNQISNSDQNLDQMSEAFYKMPNKFLKNSKKLSNLCIHALLWPIWKERNGRFFEDAYEDFTSIWDYYKMHYSFSCILLILSLWGRISSLRRLTLIPLPSPFPFPVSQNN